MATATYSFKGTADMSQHNEQIQDARKEIKKYEDEVVKAQKETKKLGNPDFSKAFTSQKNLQNIVKQTTNVMNGLSGNMMGAISKFGPYAAAAVAAFKLCEAAINKVKSVNETFNDQMDQMMAKINGAWDEFINRLSRWDWSNFLSGMRDAVNYAAALQKYTDMMGTNKLITDPRIAEINNTITEYRQNIDLYTQAIKKIRKEQGKNADVSKYQQAIDQTNKLIDEQIKKLQELYLARAKVANEKASMAAAYMGVNGTSLNSIYATGTAAYGGRQYEGQDIGKLYARAFLNMMAGEKSFQGAGTHDPGYTGLVAFITDEMQAGFTSQQKAMQKLLDAYARGASASELSKYLQQVTGMDVNWESQMGPIIKAINDWIAAVKSKATEGTDGNLVQYSQALMEKQAAFQAILDARGQGIAAQGAGIKVMETYKGPGGDNGKSKGPDWAAGSIAEIDDIIKNLKDRLANEKFDLNTQIDITKQIQDLEDKKAMLELQVAIGGNTDLTRAFGSLLDGVLQAGTVDDFCANMIDLIDKYFESAPEFQLPAVILPNKEMEEAAKEAMKNMGEIIEEEYKKICEEIRAENQEMADSFSAMGSMFESLGTMMGDEAGRWASVFGSILSTVGETISKLVALASANGVASAFELPFPANLGALATVLAGVASAVSTIESYSNKSFASGGIFEGSGPRIGDMHLARVNPGEMILNGREQANLFRMLNGGIGELKGGGSGNVTFRISGTDLVGILNNHEKINRRVR